MFAFQPHQDAFVAKAGDVVALGAVDPRQATLFPLVETALQITLDAGALLGETVVVLGLGVVGVAVGTDAPAGGCPGGRRRTAGVAARRPLRARRGDRLARRSGDGSDLSRRALVRAARDRSVGQPRRAALGVRLARPRRHCPGRLVVRQQGRVPPARPGVPPPPAHDPQHPGVDDSRRARQPMDSREPAPAPSWSCSPSSPSTGSPPIPSPSRTRATRTPRSMWAREGLIHAALGYG